MRYHSQNDEILFVQQITPDNQHFRLNDLSTGLSIIWNTGVTASLIVDGKHLEVNKNCVVFYTEFHNIVLKSYESLNVIQFNKEFYCLEKHDDEVGCRGILFFGASDVPKISIPAKKFHQFNLMWEVLLMEMDEKDSLKKEMLRIMLKRFLIICLRVYKHQHANISVDSSSVSIIKEYNYLVEKHFRNLTQVKDYAQLLFKSPKTISNIFKKHINTTPLQIINNRRLLEARRLLDYGETSIQEISDVLNFKDVQSFSHFFRRNEGLSPSAYRRRHRE